VIQLAAHPIRDCAIALGVNGTLYIWSRKFQENWSAFDPTFTTLIENQEYVEKEDEFDIKPIDTTLSKKERFTIVPHENPLALFATAVPDWYTDNSDDDVLHHLPLRIKPNAEVIKIMEARAKKRERKRKRREEREAAKKEAAKETGAENPDQEDTMRRD
jgi:COMPASS component SWD1